MIANIADELREQCLTVHTLNGDAGAFARLAQAHGLGEQQ